MCRRLTEKKWVVPIGKFNPAGLPNQDKMEHHKQKVKSEFFLQLE